MSIVVLKLYHVCELQGPYCRVCIISNVYWTIHKANSKAEVQLFRANKMASTKRNFYKPHYHKTRTIQTQPTTKTNNQRNTKTIHNPLHTNQSLNPCAKPFYLKCFRCYQVSHQSNDYPKIHATNLIGKCEYET